MTVAELQHRMGADEFATWLAYDQIAPIGPERADYRAGIIGAAVINARYGRPRGDNGVKPADLIPEWHKPRRIQTPDDQLQYVVMLNTLFGGIDERNH